jgi:UDP-N-acetylmuramoyl-L-alanyl-D-glutamate--2,6-diaminopimelate ligase
MRLRDVEHILPGARAVNLRDAEITSVTQDSRRAREGSLFVAVGGAAADGHDFVGEALRAGACAYVCEREVKGTDAPHLVVDDTHAALSALAAEFFGRPSERITCIGVTGTDGKTSTATMIRDLLDGSGGAGLTGTVSYTYGSRTIRADRTTPDAVTLQELLADMVSEGIRFAVVETSSHALVQKRTADIDFRMGVFTNLSPEHLDYHNTIEEYRNAKAILFESLPSDGWAVLNREDPASAHFEKLTRARTVGYGRGGEMQADIRECSVGSTVVRVHGMDMDEELHLRLTGRHNVQNVLAACCAARALAVAPDRIAAVMEALRPVPGRLEVVETGLACTVFVDYAHTPRALRSILEELKTLTPKRLVVVFGCGGDRDTSKRPLMGASAEEIADSVWVTSDNPRSEDPMVIIEGILSGMKNPKGVHVEPDRAAAIRGALASASAGDTVLVAGKGHERFQIVGSTMLPFEDREVIRTSSSEILRKVDGTTVCTRN